MKKLIILIAVVLGLAVNVNAQVTIVPMTISAADDTLVNADTGYATTPSLTAQYDLFFKLTNTKVSGTVAGNVILQGYNGEEWITLASDANGAISSQFEEDTATLANATGTHRWSIPKAKATYLKYRFRQITSGTQVSAPTAYMYHYYRKP